VAYPFAPNICLRDLVARLQSDGCELIDGLKLFGPRGEETARGLRRVINGRVLIAVLPNVDEREALAPSKLRSIVKKLGFDPATYGFALSNPGRGDN
jgi:hypothetical protein